MAELILTSDQFHTLVDVDTPIVVRDPTGNAVGMCSMFSGKEEAKRNDCQSQAKTSNECRDEHFTAEEIEQALRNRESAGPWYTTAEVMASLQSLEQNP